MRTTEQYLALLTSFNAKRPRFRATVGALIDPLARMQALLDATPGYFDLDDAVGVQLDAVGERVGLSRQLSYPLQGLFFTWGDPARGWGKGVWKGPYAAGVGIEYLDDDTYRRLLRAKILGNQWDGTVGGAQAILDVYFTDPDTYVWLEDNSTSITNGFFAWGDANRGWGRGAWGLRSAQVADQTVAELTATLCVAGKLPDLVDLGLIDQGAFPIKAAGTALKIAVTSVDGAPLFGWGVSNQYIGGWGEGAWAVSPEFIRNNVIPSAA